MGRIVTQVAIGNPFEPEKQILCSALVDTGASHLTLPSVWKQRLGTLRQMETVEMGLANQTTVVGEVGGPVSIAVEGFRKVFGEVLFLDMEPINGEFEPLLGYLPLEACPVAVDMLGHRLVSVKYMDLKRAR
ncbi:MAG: hypothetical protein HY037_04490 [Nitrospirae bacterium]|nr:hypothetical protein [Candidatus Troglogloeales bacterium]